ncbi:hypothetical protein HYPSUDRAFT_208096 [Hypholoma sublateritium FD-334 SS-4]|uniref:DUF6532 domain-containing protein n=1 Tax=Hypholoma sublateritium (strain FD-334 SS-4) TaxID=945553 RepID=A0A0D2NEU7_HYPSF|nr:hypothetical protein HYPSUDRAFT_208096 [Hypholoma sublateritium FD-334 SS-4]
MVEALETAASELLISHRVAVDESIADVFLTYQGRLVRSIKSKGRELVSQEYSLGVMDQESLADGSTLKQYVAKRVRGLLNSEPGPKNTTYTDGPPDQAGFPGRWNSNFCYKLISSSLFEGPSALGRKYTRHFGRPLKKQIIAMGHSVAYFCLEEWKGGEWKKLSPSNAECQAKYHSIFQAMEDARKNDYGGPALDDVEDNTISEPEGFNKAYGLDALREEGSNPLRPPPFGLQPLPASNPVLERQSEGQGLFSSDALPALYQQGLASSSEPGSLNYYDGMALAFLDQASSSGFGENPDYTQG